MLSASKRTRLSEAEAYVFLAGTYLHDIGMQCDVVKYPEVVQRARELGANFDVVFRSKSASEFSTEEQKAIRDNHHLLSAAWISCARNDGLDYLVAAIRTVPERYVEDLMDVCMYHSRLAIEDCPDSFKIETSIATPHRSWRLSGKHLR